MHCGFAANRRAGINLLLRAQVDCARIDLAQRGDFLQRKNILKQLCLEEKLARVGEKIVARCATVLTRSRLNHGLRHEVNFFTSECFVANSSQHLPVPNKHRVQAGAVVSRRSGDNPIVVVRIPLRLHQCLLTPCGSADKIGSLSGATIIRSHYLFSDHRHLMRSSMTKIYPPFRIRTLNVGGRSGSKIAINYRISSSQTTHEPLISDHSCRTAIPSAEKLSVPIFIRQPDLDVDSRFSRGFRHRYNTDERSQRRLVSQH